MMNKMAIKNLHPYALTKKELIHRLSKMPNVCVVKEDFHTSRLIVCETSVMEVSLGKDYMGKDIIVLR